jgi:pimeloyl-ACP methyl ester carboxylesterase
MGDESGELAFVGGTFLSYRWTGEGPVVVFLHGFSLDSRMWEPQLPAFARRFRVLTYDLRGFGHSELPRPGEAYRPTEDLRALLAHLGIARAHLVGLSAGGVVALGLAIEHPELVDRLVLVDSSLDGSPWSEEFVASIGRIEAVAKVEGVEAARHLWLAHPLFEPAREYPPLARRLAEIVGEYSGWHWLHESPEVGLDPPAATRLASVRAPSLVLVGERDIPDFHQIGRTLGHEIPGATVEVVRGAGHMLNMEAPGEFDRLVLGFLDSATR